MVAVYDNVGPLTRDNHCTLVPYSYLIKNIIRRSYTPLSVLGSSLLQKYEDRPQILINKNVVGGKVPIPPPYLKLPSRMLEICQLGGIGPSPSLYALMTYNSSDHSKVTKLNDSSPLILVRHADNSIR